METSKQYARIEKKVVFLLAADYLSNLHFTNRNAGSDNKYTGWNYARNGFDKQDLAV
jgi:hypothetical protein